MPQKRKLSSEASQPTSKTSRRAGARQTPSPAADPGAADGGRSAKAMQPSPSPGKPEAAPGAGDVAEKGVASGDAPAASPVEAEEPQAEVNGAGGSDKEEKRAERPASSQSRTSSRQEDQESEPELREKLKEIEAEKKQILDATHPEIVERTKLLRDICDRRIAAAKRFCDLQIENVRGLYDFEIQQADSCYHAGVEELKEIYSEQIDKKISALQTEKRDFDRRSRGPSLSASLRSAAAAAAAAINERRFAFSGGGNQAGECSTGSRIEQLLTSRRRPHQRDPVNVLSESLSDAEIRGDMQKIVNDLKQRAKKFAEDAAARKTPFMFEVSVDSSLKPPALVYGDKRFFERQNVSVYSSVSDQSFRGTILRVEDTGPDMDGNAQTPRRGGGEVTILLVDGTHARIFLKHLQTGRLMLESGDAHASTEQRSSREH
eukprot:CAMPEP_0118979578 /NCGR_PEP_ID=MMETSP1173-20130426/26288_1 /TAXON_ID=1034831 /ORGANISM="Rhizochromulina marina cf, Strain CCMP1243" /LENGTH=432 /DNA_ID=CAMNT_0006929847 /DNA_START=12 /DNA_END=1310 /DNA_ORIENTATION=-